MLPELADLASAFEIPELEQWRAEAVKALKGADFDKVLLNQTFEGITLKALYTQADVPDAAPAASAPKSAGWQMLQEIGLQQPAAFAEALSQDLEQGLEGLSLRLEQFGNPAEDLAQALSPLKPGRIPVQILTSQPIQAFEALSHWLEAQGSGWRELTGSLACDPLGVWLSLGQPEPVQGFDKLAQLAKQLQASQSQLPWLSIRALAYHEAGANAVQELAYGLASLVESIEQLEQRGIEPSQTLAHTQLQLGSGVHFLMELAKFRAARILLAQISQAYACPQVLPQLSARTSQLWLTLYDPYTNYLRQSVGALAAILGGTDALTTGCFDELTGSPDSGSRRQARNIQLLLREEVKLNRVLDPAAGSYFIESLTSELAQAAWKLFQEIEAQGGMLQALQQGKPQTEIAASAQKAQAAVYQRKQVLVGSNQYALASEQLHEPVSAPVTAGSLKPIRLAADFERLRLQSSAAKVQLLALGEPSDYRARVEFSQGFFAVAGLEPELLSGIEALQPSGSLPDVLVICSSDALYQNELAALLPVIQQKLPASRLILAGKPKGLSKSLEQAGISGFIYLGCDLFKTLAELLLKD